MILPLVLILNNRQFSPIAQDKLPKVVEELQFQSFWIRESTDFKVELMALYTYLLLLLLQPASSADLCQDGLGACDAGDLVQMALQEDVSEETLKLLQTKQATRQRHWMGREVAGWNL